MKPSKKEKNDPIHYLISKPAMGDLQVVSELITGNLVVTDDTQFNHVHADTVTILQGLNVRIYGNIKNLVLNKGARLRLHGNVQGLIDNRGGDLQIFR